MLLTVISQRALTSTCAICDCGRFTTPDRAFQRISHRSLSYASICSTQLLRKSSERHHFLRETLRQKRTLSTDTQATLQPKESSIPEYSFSVRPKEVKASTSRSQIRTSLRQWSNQNERIKDAEIPADIPSEGKVKKIPNALFIDATPVSELTAEEGQETVVDEDADENFSGHVGVSLSPGTLIAHRSVTTKPQDVVYLGDIGVQSLLAFENGTWAAETLLIKRAQISTLRGSPIPGFLTTDEVASLLAHMPKRDVTRSLEDGGPSTTIDVTGTLPDNVSASVVSKLRALREAKARFRRDYKTQLDHMYETLALEQEWRRIRLQDLSPLILGVEFTDMSDTIKAAFVDYANKFHPFFIPVQTAETLTYYIAPKSLDESVKQVQEWARLYQEAAAQAAVGKNVSALLRENPLSSFIDKARRIILKSRQLRTPTILDSLGTSQYQSVDGSNDRVFTGETFTSEDKKILTYLYDVTFRRPISRASRAHASLIVRAVGAYPSTKLDQHVFRLLMYELGCVNHWEILEDISFPTFGRKTSVELDRLKEEVATTIRPFTNQEKRCTTFADSMAHLRKDWGSMEAFCIDSARTKNLEDAISLEPTDEIEGGHWIHCHFAHPTSHIDKDHPVVKLARKLGSGYYAIDENSTGTPMVPPEVNLQFSIRHGAPVLTVSALLTKDGCVHNVKVTPAILKNIIPLDRDAVYEAMGGEEEVDQAILVVGQVSRVPRAIRMDKDYRKQDLEQDTETLTRYLPQLELLKELLSARREHRKQEVPTPARFLRSDFRVDVSTRQPEGRRSDRDFESYHWMADPGIMVTAKRSIDTSSTIDEHRIHDLTAQAMRLAAESLGKWMADRNIPAVFLGNATPAGFSIDQLNRRGIHEQPLRPLFLRTPYPNPLLHHNLKQYASCSSPLRIFIDMFNHMQVDSYLKAQANGLLLADQAVDDDSVLAFSKTEVERFLNQDIYAGDAMSTDSVEDKQLWITQALFRAFHFKEAVLPETMEVLVTRPSKRNRSGKLMVATGALIPWGIPVQLVETPEGYERKARVNEYVPMKLLSVFPSQRLVTGQAVGPPSIKQQILDPIRSYTPDNFVQQSTRFPLKPLKDRFRKRT